MVDYLRLETRIEAFFALRPFNAKFPFYFFSELQSTIAVSAALSLISWIEFCSPLSQSRIVYQFGTVVFLVAGSILLASPLVLFVSGHSPLYHLQGLPFPETPFFSMIGAHNKINITPGIEAIARSIEATFVASFVLAFVFRLRGWRFKGVVRRRSD